MKIRIENLLKNKRAQEKNLEAALIAEESKEARAEIGETLKKLREEIAELEGISDDMDEPVDAPADAPAADAAPEESGARKLSPVATMRTAGKEDHEARAKAFAESGKLSVTAAEARSVLLSTGSIAKPTSVGGINDTFNVVSSIVDKVKVEDMTGMGGHKEAYIKSWQTAGALEDGKAPAESDPVFGMVAINPFLLGVVTYVSRELKKQSPLQYEEKVREGALIALRQKLAAWIVNGGGTNEIYGIVNAVNTAGDSMIDTLDMTGAIDEHFLRNLVFAYGGNENVNGSGTLYLNKLDLIAFGDVRGADKKPVYEIIPDGSNPNTGIIKDSGLSVPYCINSACAAYSTAESGKSMFYGADLNYKLGLFGDYEVNVSDDYKFGEGLLTVRGEVMVGGNVIADKGFVVVNKTA